jgi:EpsI family protein
VVSRSRFLTVYLLIAAAALYISLHADVTVPVNAPLESFPAMIGGWRMTSQIELDEAVIDTLRPTDYLERTYEGRDGGTVELYIGYHGGGKESGEIHSPKHCLPGSGWQEDSSIRTQMNIDGRKINLVRAVYQKGETEELFYYWYQVGEHTLSDMYSLKLAQIADSILHNRRDAAFVRISVPVQADETRASADGKKFIQDFYPTIRKFLPS